MRRYLRAQVPETIWPAQMQNVCICGNCVRDATQRFSHGSAHATWNAVLLLSARNVSIVSVCYCGHDDAGMWSQCVLGAII